MSVCLVYLIGYGCGYYCGFAGGLLMLDCVDVNSVVVRTLHWLPFSCDYFCYDLVGEFVVLVVVICIVGIVFGCGFCCCGFGLFLVAIYDLLCV